MKRRDLATAALVAFSTASAFAAMGPQGGSRPTVTAQRGAGPQINNIFAEPPSNLARVQETIRVNLGPGVSTGVLADLNAAAGSKPVATIAVHYSTPSHLPTGVTIQTAATALRKLAEGAQSSSITADGLRNMKAGLGLLFVAGENPDRVMKDGKADSAAQAMIQDFAAKYLNLLAQGTEPGSAYALAKNYMTSQSPHKARFPLYDESVAINCPESPANRSL